jgi:hypothetical protein
VDGSKHSRLDAGCALVYPSRYSDVAGVALIALALGMQLMRKRTSRRQ